MAKRGALEHPKTMELAALLGIDECFALGILEALWHHVARYFPSGDVTPAKPALLARSLRYSGDGAALWAALIEAGFLEERAGWCIVHDWSEHADDAVHMGLARKGLLFADGTKPRYTRLSVKEREEAERLYAQRAQENAQRAHSEEPCAHTVRTALPSPALAMPCTKDPPYTPPTAEPDRPAPAAPVRGRVVPAGWEAHWETFLAVYPKRDGDRRVKDGREHYRRLLATGTDPALILAGVRAYREWADHTDKTGTSLVKQIPSFLNGRAWEEPWDLPKARGPTRNGTSPPGARTMAERHAELMTALREDDERREQERTGGGGRQGTAAVRGDPGEPEADHSGVDAGLGPGPPVGRGEGPRDRAGVRAPYAVRDLLPDPG